jgi:hypothetical protein
MKIYYTFFGMATEAMSSFKAIAFAVCSKFKQGCQKELHSISFDRPLFICMICVYKIENTHTQGN